MKQNQYPISAEQRNTYAADGALILPGVLDRSWIDRLRQLAERLEVREVSEGAPDGFFDRQRVWEHDDGVRG